jgi:hypothetical protein
MIYLQFNTASQTAYFTLDEGRSFYSTSFTHYLLVMVLDGVGVDRSGTKLAQVLSVANENTRATEVVLTTVGLINHGTYQYYVYGQNSSSNIDPLNASVVGLVERGTLIIQNTTDSFEIIEGQQTIKIID